MDEARKFAYRCLIDFSLDEIRTHIPADIGFWTYQKNAREAQFAIRLAFCIRRLSRLSRVDFEGFDEQEFWTDLKRLENDYPPFSSEDYLKAFERGLHLFVDRVPDHSQMVIVVNDSFEIQEKGLIVLCGCVECEKLCVGDEIIAVTDRTIPYRTRIFGLETINRTMEVAKRGDEIGVVVREWSEFKLGKGTQLFLPPSPPSDK